MIDTEQKGEGSSEKQIANIFTPAQALAFWQAEREKEKKRDGDGERERGRQTVGDRRGSF